MSWTLPRERFTISQVLDSEEWNANVYAFAEEIDGNLNEHNFTRLTALALETISEDSCLRYYVQRSEVSPTGATGSMSSLKQMETWSPVENTEVEFSSLGNKVLAICSFQCRNPVNLQQPGLNFCLALDGVPQASTIIGTGDATNDLTKMNRLVTAGKTIKFAFGTGPGVLALHTPLMLKGLFTVTPGYHRIQLFARNLDSDTGNASQHISNRETIVLPMWT
jgi:hypothetical protein